MNAMSRRRIDRQAFTLPELLVVMAIITMLATVLMFTLREARNNAKEARTKGQIARLNEAILERWEGYRTRAVPIRMPAGFTSRQAAGLRLAALRELMRMELPERISDVQDGPVTPGLPAPALWHAYRRRVAANGGFGNWSQEHMGAECLYLIMSTMQVGDANAVSMFGHHEVGDTDADGMPEILDGWGRPISFVRWAPGLRSTIQEGNAAVAPDPLDPLRVNPSWTNPDPSQHPFALFPLVFSAGPDGLYDININGALSYRATVPPNDPYFAGPPPVGTRMDADGDGDLSYFDNIDNHFGLNN